jgi:hypothetical protein
VEKRDLLQSYLNSRSQSRSFDLLLFWTGCDVMVAGQLAVAIMTPRGRTDAYPRIVAEHRLLTHNSHQTHATENTASLITGSPWRLIAKNLVNVKSAATSTAC